MRRLLGILLLLAVGYVALHSGGSYHFTLPALASVAGSGGGSYRDLARQDAQAAGIPADLFINQINHESGFNPAARGGSGEIGIAQFMPSTAAGLGVNPADPGQSLRVAASLMGRYYHANGGDYAKALAGYNCGGGCLARAVVHGGLWGCYVPGSTRAYILFIMGVSVC